MDDTRAAVAFNARPLPVEQVVVRVACEVRLVVQAIGLDQSLEEHKLAEQLVELVEHEAQVEFF